MKDDNTFKNAREKVEKENMEILGIRNHPDNPDLCYLLAYSGEGQDTYVIWSYNDSTKNLEYGHDFSQLEVALREFNRI